MASTLKKNIESLRGELKGYSSQQRLFIFFAMFCGFFICCEYSIVRPISNALLMESYGVKALPYVWLCVIPINFLFVSLYNRWLPKWGSARLFFGLMGIILVLNALFAIYCKEAPKLIFIFYMWKEIYIMLLFQLVWSVIHANVQFSRAKYLYGLFFGIGGVGSIFGASFPGFFALRVGSENLLFFTFPVYFLLLLAYIGMNHYCQGESPKEGREQKGGFAHGIKLIASSRFLIFALLTVTFMQMITATIDFQFNDFLERFVSGKDLRTQYGARVMGLIHVVTVFMQFIGTYILIQSIGFRRSHYFVPTILAIGAIGVVFFPVFAMVSLAFITCKSLDFSVFGVVKEMLYVPLSPDEKFRAKSVIDVFAYRSSKGVASLLILGLTPFLPSAHLSYLVFVLAIGWIVSISYGLREFEKLAAVEGNA